MPALSAPGAYDYCQVCGLPVDVRHLRYQRQAGYRPPRQNMVRAYDLADTSEWVLTNLEVDTSVVPDLGLPWSRPTAGARPVVLRFVADGAGTLAWINPDPINHSLVALHLWVWSVGCPELGPAPVPVRALGAPGGSESPQDRPAFSGEAYYGDLFAASSMDGYDVSMQFGDSTTAAGTRVAVLGPVIYPPGAMESHIWVPPGTDLQPASNGVVRGLVCRRCRDRDSRFLTEKPVAVAASWRDYVTPADYGEDNS